MSRNRIMLALVAIGPLLGGCADYLNHYDTVTLAEGDAPHHNVMLHTVDPFNPASKNTKIEGDGKKGAGAVWKYWLLQSGEAAPAQPATGAQN